MSDEEFRKLLIGEIDNWVKEYQLVVLRRYFEQMSLVKDLLAKKTDVVHIPTSSGNLMLMRDKES